MPYHCLVLEDYTIGRLEAVPTASIRQSVRGSDISAVFAEQLAMIFDLAGSEAAGPPFAMWHEFKDGIFDMEIGLPVNRDLGLSGEVYSSSLGGKETLQWTYRGAYDGLTEAYHTIHKWITDNGYIAVGPPWDWYIDDPNTTNEANCRTLICWPIQKT